MDLNVIFSCIGSILQPLLYCIELLFGSFIRDDMVILGLPFYQWVIGFFVVVTIGKLLLEEVFDG